MRKQSKEARSYVRRGLRVLYGSTPALVPARLFKCWGPLVPYLDLWLCDYGIVREFYPNLHPVADGVWRSAQPAPRHLRALARRGVRTVVNLRGAETHGPHALEVRTCAELGLKLIDLRLRSRAAPARADIAAMRDIISAMDQPTLVHCKSGSDRTGMFCALYLVFRAGVPVAEARKQLTFRYGHICLSKTGILDHLFDAYLAQNAQTPIAFGTWLDEAYDPEVLTNSFRELSWRRRATGFKVCTACTVEISADRR